MKYLVNTPVNHNQKMYLPGSEIELTEAEAAQAGKAVSRLPSEPNGGVKPPLPAAGPQQTKAEARADAAEDRAEERREEKAEERREDAAAARDQKAAKKGKV
ncbi:MAG: hypothetical protein ABSE93_09415 [Terriglobia bacterium]|jgi:hypothetical protein